MNRKIIAGLIAVAVLLVAGIFIFKMPNRDSAKQVDNRGQVSSRKNDAPSSANGKYIPYTPIAFNDAAGTQRVLFFSTSWCSTCRDLDRNIRAGVVPPGVTILRVDYDTEDALRSKYNVRTQHTLVQVDERGNQIKQWYGSYTISQIMDQLKQ